MKTKNKSDYNLKLIDFIPIYGIAKYGDRCYYEKKNHEADKIGVCLQENFGKKQNIEKIQNNLEIIITPQQNTNSDEGYIGNYHIGTLCSKKVIDNALFLSVYNGLIIGLPLFYALDKIIEPLFK